MNSTKITILAIISLSLIFIVGTFLFISQNNNVATDVKTDSAATADYIDEYTLDESGNSETDVTIDQTDNKITVIEKNDSNIAKNSSDGKNVVVPVVVYADVFGSNLEISAYVPLVESGGTCTATITSVASGKVTTSQGESTPGASTTDCILLTIPVSQLESGLQTVVVSYSSAATQGSSDATEVSVP